MEFNESEKALILSLTSEKITLEEFLQFFARSAATDKNFILDALRRIVATKDADSLTYLLYLWGFLKEPVDEARLKILRPLVAEQWHKDHEWIVDMLKDAKDAAALPFLVTAAQAQYPQLDELDQTSLQKRCLYAIKKISNDKTEVLE
ncbi:MAG TPA: hypothetical protein VJI96_03135 [Candidatus Andersenbacteria bacterium]|nr:hypothetical protein [Candidatus Andersenbacteria bacterium]